MKSGDIVTLKSGGPEMTVEYVYTADDTCKCSWFVNDMKYMDTFAQKAVDVKKQNESFSLTENKTYQDKIDKYIELNTYKTFSENLEKLQLSLNAILVDSEQILNKITETNDSDLFLLVEQIEKLFHSINILHLIQQNIKNYATSWDSRKDIISKIKNLNK